MPRVKGGTTARKRRKKILKLAKGYVGSRSLLYRTAHEQVMKSLAYAYRDRKVRKREFRKLWISRINAAAKINGFKYSKLIHGLALANVKVNRKMLSEIAIHAPEDFAQYVTIAKNAIEGVLAKPAKVEAKEVKEVVEDIQVDEKEITTAGVFSKLDESASKTEDFVAKNQKVIIGFVAAIALVTVGYLAFEKFIATPKEEEAANEMFVAQQNFQKATDGVASDSLYKLSLNGSEGKFGFIKIAEEYSGTDAGNLANYYAGIAYLNTGKYAEAIDFLSKFESKDMILGALAKGAIGDAYAQKNQQKEALENYIKAAESSKNDFTTPRFLLKAGKTALALGNKEEALKYFTEIKDFYDATPEAASVDVLIGLAQ